MALTFVSGSTLPICCSRLIDCVEKDLGRESRAEVARIFWLLDFVPIPETIDISYYWQVLSEHSWANDPLYQSKAWREDLVSDKQRQHEWWAVKTAQHLRVLATKPDKFSLVPANQFLQGLLRPPYAFCGMNVHKHTHTCGHTHAHMNKGQWRIGLRVK